MPGPAESALRPRRVGPDGSRDGSTDTEEEGRLEKYLQRRVCSETSLRRGPEETRDRTDGVEGDVYGTLVPVPVRQWS